ncbi:MAG TPA: tetratricopeptide repeat protein [Thermoanaerobaculia bacterium]|nr:tetratricopeptide repeat protein [Thermoanaerobaculia bacterium]
MRKLTRRAGLALVLAGAWITTSAATVSPAELPSPAADAYARGQKHLAGRTTEDLRAALKDFEQATAADGTFAPAFAGLAETRALLYDYPQAREAAQQALALDDRQAAAHAVVGFVRMHADWDWAGAEGELQRALEIEPGKATPHLWYAILLEATGRSDEAVKEARRAVDLAPGDARVRAGLGYRLYWARRYDEAVTELTAALGLDPALETAHYFIGRSRVQQGRFDEARAAFARARKLSPRDANLLSASGYLEALAGKRKEAERILAELERLANRGLPFASQIAGIHAALGHKAIALGWLDTALAAREGALVWLKIDPRFESLRGEPRFAEILRTLKLAG